MCRASLDQVSFSLLPPPLCSTFSLSPPPLLLISFPLSSSSSLHLSFTTQLVYVSGTLKVSKDEPFIACIVHPVSPPSILELRMEGNMFVTHYAMDMTCLFFDGR